MENLPSYIGLVFGLTTILTFGLFYKASNKSKTTLIILSLWLGFQSLIGIAGFYTVTNTIPPRFLLLVLPPILLIIGLFSTSNDEVNLANHLHIHQLSITSLSAAIATALLCLVFLNIFQCHNVLRLSFLHV
jgi:hypothetical protein